MRLKKGPKPMSIGKRNAMTKAKGELYIARIISEPLKQAVTEPMF
jgi:hypothetical protein